MGGDRLTGDVGNGQRHQQGRAHRPHPGGHRPYPQGAIAIDIEDAAVLGGHQKRREQERSDGHDRGDLTGGPNERQANRGHRTGIGQPGRGQRGRQRERPDTRRGAAGQRRHPDQQRPHHRAAASSRSIRHKQRVRSRVLRASRTARLRLAGDELVARDVRDVVEILKDGL